MRIDVPGRGAADIGRVAVVGPVWTDPDMYRETCYLLQRTADAAEAGTIEFGWLPWHAGEGDGHMLRQMVRDLAAECDDGSPCVDAVCLLPGWNADGAATFAAAVANTCGAAVMGLEEWLRALEPDDAKSSEEVSGR
jgi:hypothetical protein